jgi:hypothetical protein
VGDERRRYCSECCLHVHNAAELTRREARTLVSAAPGRVCMRVEYDARGAPLHRRSRLVRWAFAAGAALLAACQGGREPAPAPQPAEPPSRMGRVVARQELGEVAVQPPVVRPSEVLGGAEPTQK